jgi:hypothetical protein
MWLGHIKIFSKTTGPILIRLITNHPLGEWIQLCSGDAFLQGEIIAKSKSTLKYFEFFSQHQQAKFNQTLYKSFLDKGNSKGQVFFK